MILAKSKLCSILFPAGAGVILDVGLIYNNEPSVPRRGGGDP